MIPGTYNPPPRAGFAMSFLAKSGANGANTVQTFNGLAAGAAESSRLIVVAVHWNITGAATLNAATFNGVAVLGILQCSGTNTGVALIWGVVAAGTTVDVVCTFSASVASCRVASHRIVGQASNAPFFTHNPVGGGISARAVTLDLPANGGAIAVSTGDAAGTWALATEQYDDTAQPWASGATLASLTAAAGQVITRTSCRVICGASWG